MFDEYQRNMSNETNTNWFDDDCEIDDDEEVVGNIFSGFFP